MDTKVLSVILLVIFFALMIFVGLRTRKSANNVEGFVLASRSVGPWMTAFAFGTSYFSAVIFVGYAGQFGWNFGLSATWAGLGNAFIGSLLAWNILGRRTRIMTQHLDAKTMPDFFGKRFNSTTMKVIASIIIFIFLIPYTASLYNGLSSLFGLVFDIPYWVVIAIMAVLTGFYVMFGGYMATAVNDFIQGIIMLFGICAVIGAVLTSNGGLVEATKTLSSVPAEGWTGGAFTSFLGPDPLALLFVVILTSLGTWGLPQMVHKFYAIKSEDAIKKGTVISTIFALVVAGGSYFLGGLGRVYCTADAADGTGRIFIDKNGAKLDFDAIIPALLNSCLPDIMIGLVVVLVLSASMSTLSSLVLTSSSTVTIDLIRPLTKGKMNEKKEVLVMRIFIAVFLLISVVIALNKNAYISTLMSISWGALAGAFLAPFMYGLYSKKVTRAAVAACFISGVGITVVHMFVFSLGFFPELTAAAAKLRLNMASPINAGAIAMLAGLVIVPVVSRFTSNSDQAELDKAFDCYRK